MRELACEQVHQFGENYNSGGSTTSTVKPRFTATLLIRTTHYYGQFALSLGKESPYSFP